MTIELGVFLKEDLMNKIVTGEKSMETEVQYFLLKVLMGRKQYATTDDKILYGCVSKAYDDMMTAGRFVKLKKEGNIKKICDLIKSEEYQFSKELIRKCCDVFPQNLDANYINKKGENVQRSATPFGLAQKVINMAYKYFYCFKESGVGNFTKQIDYSGCHCPLDSIILKELKESEISWSKLDEEAYDDMQEKIKCRLKKDYPGHEGFISKIGNLAFDFLAW